MKPHLYFIAIIPPQPALNTIEQVKRDIAEKYHSRHALKSPAHLTLQMPFKRKSESEENLCRFLESFSKKLNPFTISLNGFGHFEKRVVFIRVEENNYLPMLFNRLNSALRDELNFSNNETPQHFHPHITVAHRDISYSVFKDAWQEFEHREFKLEFTASAFSLLKHNFKNWEVLQNFSFG